MLNLLLIICTYGAVMGQKAMEIHSFDNDIDHPTFLSRWWNAGASIPLEKHIVLTPSVSDRFGAQWHKYPLLTNDFEASFTVNVKPPLSGAIPANDQGFAFWYVYDNVTSTMPADILDKGTEVISALKSRGYGLFGYKNQFHGFGVVFSNNKKGPTPDSTEFKPSVSIVVNDGSRNIAVPGDIPTQFGAYWNYRTQNLQVKVRVQKRSIVVEGKSENTKNWVKLGEVPSDKMPMDITTGGYIGFTGSIAADVPGGTKSSYGQHDAVMIDNVVLTNMDSRQTGEEIVTPDPDVGQNSQEKHSEFLHDKSDEGVERAEGLAIKKFSAILFKFISETEPQKKAMMSAISSLSSKLVGMERAVKKLKDEIVALSGHDMDADYAKMKDELAALSGQAANKAEAKKKQFENLKSEIENSIESKMHAKRASSAQVARTLHEADSKARDLKAQVASRGSFTLYIALFCLVAVVVAGVALQAKLRRWEKKHLL